jgi:TRAP-type C4-dicarboxylate transport system permease small subunit
VPHHQHDGGWSRLGSALNNILDRLEEWIIATLIGAATILTFIAVVHRYGASNSAGLGRWAGAHGFVLLQHAADWIYTSLAAVNLSWAQELATYMFVWMAKFGAALGVRTGIHVGVDVFVQRLAPAARKPVIVFALLCGALFTGVIGTLGAVYVHELDPDQGLAGARMAELDHLSLHSARLLFDVLPFPAGNVALSAHRSDAASRPRRRVRAAAG